MERPRDARNVQVQAPIQISFKKFITFRLDKVLVSIILHKKFLVTMAESQFTVERGMEIESGLYSISRHISLILRGIWFLHKINKESFFFYRSPTLHRYYTEELIQSTIFSDNIKLT